MAKAEGAGEVSEEKPKINYDQLYASGSGLNESPARFPEVRGVCRTCNNAHIFRRELSEVPVVFCCLATHMTPMRMPLDISECSDFKRRGEMRLEQLAEIAHLIDTRKRGGQYL